MESENSKSASRRQFLKKVSTGSALAISGLAFYSTSSCKQTSEEKTTLLTPEGNLVQVPNSEIEAMNSIPFQQKNLVKVFQVRNLSWSSIWPNAKMLENVLLPVTNTII